MTLLRSLAVLLLILFMTSGAAAAARSTPPPKKPPVESGLASWFRTKRALVGAHRTLPLGTKVKVSAKNGHAVVVTIRGRGPFIRGRIIDLSSDAFKKLASLGTGILRVTIERVK